jgi:hypothetical protein
MVIRIAILTLAAASGAIAAPPPLQYNRDVRPILSENCFHCHGADAGQRQAELRLDVRESAIDAGAIMPSSPATSPLVERITSADPDVKMPPPDSHRQLSAEQIAILERWIAEGAEYEPHWAFQPIERPEPPPVGRQDWPQNDIDRFVLSRLEQAGRPPTPRAPLPALLRRISFDVTGLPPSRAQLAAWQAAPDAVGAALDELLASPHYGERMAVDWLDVARYADTHGFNNDSARTMWRWRDWVIDALNANMPYDRFITVQLAGDLLEDATLEDLIATGFNRNHVINSEGGIIDEEYRVEYVADRVRTTSLAWLGLTLECARCHDHKFDPVSQREYYQMFAFFNNVDETGEDGRIANAAPLMRAPTRDQQRRYAEMRQADRGLEADLRGLMDTQPNEPPPAKAAAPWKGVEAQVALQAADEPLELPAAAPPRPEIASFDCSEGWTWMAWVKRRSEGGAALFSTMDYSAPASSQGYGDGVQVGIADGGAVEVRVASRWPGYALSVVSTDRLPVGQWSHVAITGSGTTAAGVRVFIDAVEVETDARHDDLSAKVQIRGAAHLGDADGPDAQPLEGALYRMRLVKGAVDSATLQAVLEAETAENPAGDSGEGGSWAQRLARAAAVRRGADPKFAAVEAAWRTARRERLAFQRSFPTLMIVRECTPPRESFVLERGQYDKPGDPVTPDVPQALGLPLPDGAPRNRLTLARWLTDPRHPLTARVVVNRYWHSLFGVGLVKTLEDLGTQGEWPSHPELLDWLAAEFIDSGWDAKRLVRLIVSSATYQQDSTAPADGWQHDPENRLLARGPRQRLSAEMIRDQALAASGLLAPRLGGPPVFPYQPPDLYNGIVVAADYPGTKYELSQGEDLHRRSLYTFWKRTVPHPTMSTFDAPDREFCTARRSITNTPLQALALMNDPIFLEAAGALGQRMRAQGGATDQARLAWGFELLTGRRPSGAEVARLLSLLEDQRSEFASGPAPPEGLLEFAGRESAGGATASDRAAYASVASLLLNLDEALTRN